MEAGHSQRRQFRTDSRRWKFLGGGGVTPSPTPRVSSFAEYKCQNVESTLYGKYLVKATSSDDALLVLLMDDDPTNQQQTIYAMAFSQNPTQSAQDTGVLYKTSFSDVIHYSEYEQLSKPVPHTVAEYWDFCVSMGDSEAWIDDGIAGMIDVNEAVEDVMEVTGRHYTVQ